MTKAPERTSSGAFVVLRLAPRSERNVVRPRGERRAVEDDLLALAPGRGLLGARAAAGSRRRLRRPDHAVAGAVAALEVRGLGVALGGAVVPHPALALRAARRLVARGRGVGELGHRQDRRLRLELGG